LFRWLRHFNLSHFHVDVIIMIASTIKNIDTKWKQARFILSVFTWEANGRPIGQTVKKELRNSTTSNKKSKFKKSPGSKADLLRRGRCWKKPLAEAVMKISCNRRPSDTIRRFWENQLGLSDFIWPNCNLTPVVKNWKKEVQS